MGNTHTNGFYILLAVAVVFFIFGLFGGYDIAKNRLSDMRTGTDTVVVERWDTVTIGKPTEVIRYITRYDTVRTTEPVVNSDTLENGQIKPSAALIPIESVVYKDSTEDAQYTAYVSGYRAALDSVSINCRNTVTTVTNTIEKKQRKMSLGVQLGYGVTKSGLSPYVGVGISYRLF